MKQVIPFSEHDAQVLSDKLAALNLCVKEIKGRKVRRPPETNTLTQQQIKKKNEIAI